MWETFIPLGTNSDGKRLAFFIKPLSKASLNDESLDPSKKSAKPPPCAREHLDGWMGGKFRRINLLRNGNEGQTFEALVLGRIVLENDGETDHTSGNNDETYSYGIWTHWVAFLSDKKDIWAMRTRDVLRDAWDSFDDDEEEFVQYDSDDEQYDEAVTHYQPMENLFKNNSRVVKLGKISKLVVNELKHSGEGFGKVYGFPMADDWYSVEPWTYPQEDPKIDSKVISEVEKE